MPCIASTLMLGFKNRSCRCTERLWQGTRVVTRLRHLLRFLTKEERTREEERRVGAWRSMGAEGEEGDVGENKPWWRICREKIATVTDNMLILFIEHQTSPKYKALVTPLWCAAATQWSWRPSSKFLPCRQQTLDQLRIRESPLPSPPLRPPSANPHPLRAALAGIPGL